MPYLTNFAVEHTLVLRGANPRVDLRNHDAANDAANDAADSTPNDATQDAGQGSSSNALDWSPEAIAALRARGQVRSEYLKAKNRRKRYLEVHPEYFEDDSLELGEPLLYDRYIRRFQTAAEREAEGQKKGFSEGFLSNLCLAEARAVAILESANRGETSQDEEEGLPESKEEGREWWIDEMRQRFLRGDDTHFDYSKVDTNEKYNDPEEERDIEEAYFDSLDSDDYDSDGQDKEKVLTGETGILDY